MERFLLILVLLVGSVSSFSQEAVNKTDAKGLKQGKWVSRYPGGSLKYEGYFIQNRPAGEWKRYHENGKIKANMTYRLNSERVYASMFDEEGKLYAKGIFEGTVRDSTWNFFSGDLLVMTENYQLGKKEGKAVSYDQSGVVLSEKEFRNDLLDGLSAEYFPTGIKKNEIVYLQGKKNGPARFFDENGMITMEGNYMDDLSDGTWKIFESGGKLKYQIKYEKGELKDSGALDTLQRNEFRKYENARGKIPEPKLNESGRP